MILNPNGDFGNEFIEVNDRYDTVVNEDVKLHDEIGYTRKITNNHVTGTAFNYIKVNQNEKLKISTNAEKLEGPTSSFLLGVYCYDEKFNLLDEPDLITDSSIYHSTSFDGYFRFGFTENYYSNEFTIASDKVKYIKPKAGIYHKLRTLEVHTWGTQIERVSKAPQEKLYRLSDTDRTEVASYSSGDSIADPGTYEYEVTYYGIDNYSKTEAIRFSVAGENTSSYESIESLSSQKEAIKIFNVTDEAFSNSYFITSDWKR